MTTTDDTTPPENDRIEFVDIQVEMQRSYLDYAMSVIVGRALPDVRDGLKPVHRRVLYAMFDGGYRPDRGYSKCSRVVGDVMGQYHPHGDSSIYDALVRLAQSWSLRYPMVDGNGNFGSPGNDPAAAMRYCVTADTRVRMTRGTPQIADIVPGAAPNSDHDVELKLVGRAGDPVLATKFFHSGDHSTRRIRTREGYELAGSLNHPVLCLVDVFGVPTLLWKLLDEVGPGDYVVMLRAEPVELGSDGDAAESLALLAGAWVSEGWASQGRAGFNNTDVEFFDAVLAAYDDLVGGSRYVSSRIIASGSTIHEIDIQDMTAFGQSALAPMVGDRSAAKRVPDFVWSASAATKATFLRALFTGDGSVSRLPRNTIQVSYSTISIELARGVQDLLLELGVVSRLTRHADGEFKVVISNIREARRFSWSVGFLGEKQTKLASLVAELPHRTVSLSSDRVPYLAAFLRRHGAQRWTERDWLRRHNVDRIARWETDRDEIAARISPEALAVAEPLVDGRYYYAEVVAVEDTGVQPVYSVRVDSEDHAFITNGFVSHNTEARLDPIAMAMMADIDEDTVDFSPNYDGRAQEPDVLPSRIPNLLVNGSGGIAVGMATNIPPHNLREVASGVQWALTNPQASAEELLEALLERIKGPDFPTHGLIVGRRGIEDAYRTGRGSVTMRAVVNVEEINNRMCLVITELPYQVNPDNLALKIADLVKDGKIAGIADVRDEGNERLGQRLVIVLKRDAVAKVVENNLYKHTQLQDTFGCNMLALVDGVPRTLRLDEFVKHYIDHQVEVIVRRTRFRLRKKEERAHILRALLKALDRLDDVIALIRASDSAEAARGGLMALLEIDEIQAVAILDMQLRRLAALERQKIIDEATEIEREIAELNAILASPERQREIISEELAEHTEKFGDDRRTQIVAAEGDMSMEDLIAEEDVVVTITNGGYAKRTKSDLYRSQGRGGKGVRGAQLKQDDIVDHFFTTTTHHWILFFTNKGRVYRAKAYELPEAARDARGQHVANLLAFQPDESIAQVLDLRDYEAAPYLVLATRGGKVKKTALALYDSPRQGGVIAINLEEGDELIGAELVSAQDDLLLVSRKAMSVRFTADDAQLRPMGRATAGVTGMKFREGDELLSMSVVREDSFVFTATDGGFAKRTPVEEYRVQGRAGLGIKAMKIVEERGALAGALVVDANDEVLAVTTGGGVIRTRVNTVNPTGRDTMGVRLINLKGGDAVVAVARNAEIASDDDADLADADESADLGDSSGLAESAEPAEMSADGGDVRDTGDASETTEVTDEGGA